MAKSVDFRSITALVIDDQETIRSMMRAQLRELGCLDIEVARNAEEGAAAIARSQPDLVVSDINMPGRNGLELLRDIRAGLIDHVPRDTRVVLLTGHSDSTIVGTAMALDAHGFIAKPVSIRLLAERIERAILRPIEIGDAERYRAVVVPTIGPMSMEVGKPAAGPALETIGQDQVETPLGQVVAGALLARNLRAGSGHLLVPAGTRLSATLIERLIELAEIDTTLTTVWVADQPV
jgi:CheY-like chemotaxis protein